MAYMVGSSVIAVAEGCLHGDGVANSMCLRTMATVTWNLVAGMGCFWALQAGVSAVIPEAAPFLKTQLGGLIIGTLGQPLLEVCMSLVNIVSNAWEASKSERDAGLDELDKAFHCGSWSSVAAGIKHLAASTVTFWKELFISSWDVIRTWFKEVKEFFAGGTQTYKSTVSMQMSPILRDFLLDNGYQSLRLEVRCLPEYKDSETYYFEWIRSFFEDPEPEEPLDKVSAPVQLSRNRTAYSFESDACLISGMDHHKILATGGKDEIKCLQQDDLDIVGSFLNKNKALNQTLAMAQCDEIDAFCVTTADGKKKCFSAVEGRFEFTSKPVKIDIMANMMARIKMIHSDENRIDADNPYWQFHTYHWVNKTQSGMDISHFDYTAWCIGDSAQHCKSPKFVVEVGSPSTSSTALTN